MIRVEAGVARKATPLRLGLVSRSVIFCEMIDWYYRTNDSMLITYEDIDDRLGRVTISDEIGNTSSSRSFTIGMNDKRQIERSYLFYHQDTRV